MLYMYVQTFVLTGTCSMELNCTCLYFLSRHSHLIILTLSFLMPVIDFDISYVASAIASIS